MTWRAEVNDICAAFPGADLSHPFGEGADVWKVGGKIFAIQHDGPTGISLKCPDTETAEMLREIGVGTKAPYLHRSWIALPETTDMDEIRHRAALSYDTIRAGLPKKVQTALPERSA